MTNVTAMPMPAAVETFFETPRKGQMPRNLMRTKFSIRIAVSDSEKKFSQAHDLRRSFPSARRRRPCTSAMMSPSVRNPPGAIIMTAAGVKFAPKSETP